MAWWFPERLKRNEGTDFQVAEQSEGQIIWFRLEPIRKGGNNHNVIDNKIKRSLPYQDRLLILQCKRGFIHNRFPKIKDKT